MSFTSPQSSASAESARFNAYYANQLANLTLPEISSTINSAFSDLRSAQQNGGIPQSVRNQFDPIIQQTNQDYASVGQGQSAYIKQAARQSGNIMGPNTVSDALRSAGMTLEQSRREAQQNIAYQEAAQGLTQYNQLLNLMGAGAGEAIGLGGTFGGMGTQALQYLNPVSQGGSTLAGAASGASLGTQISPGWGTLIGGAIGAAGGYLSYGG